MKFHEFHEKVSAIGRCPLYSVRFIEVFLYVLIRKNGRDPRELFVIERCPLYRMSAIKLNIHYSNNAKNNAKNNP